MSLDPQVLQPDTAPRRTAPIALHSALVFAAVELLTMIVHEFCHAAAALALGYRPVVHSHYVAVSAEGRDQVIIALAGPVASLVLGLVLLALARRARGYARLPLSWAGLLGVNVAVGYLLTAPFFAAGDIGSALAILHAPRAAAIALTILGALGIVALGRPAASLFAGLAGDVARRPQIRAIGMLGWVIGAPLLVLLTWPPVGVATISVLTSGVFTCFVVYFLPRLRRVTPGTTAEPSPAEPNPADPWRPAPLTAEIAVLLVLVLLTRFVLVPGVAL